MNTNAPRKRKHTKQREKVAFLLPTVILIVMYFYQIKSINVCQNKLNKCTIIGAIVSFNSGARQ